MHYYARPCQQAQGQFSKSELCWGISEIPYMSPPYPRAVRCKIQPRASNRQQSVSWMAI